MRAGYYECPLGGSDVTEGEGGAPKRRVPRGFERGKIKNDSEGRGVRGCWGWGKFLREAKLSKGDFRKGLRLFRKNGRGKKKDLGM